MDEAECNVGKDNGMWIIILSILGGGFAVIVAGLIAGNTQDKITPQLKWGVICMLLSPILIGYIMACCIACKISKASK